MLQVGIVGPEDDCGHGTRKVAKGVMSDEKTNGIEQSLERPRAWGPTLNTDSDTKAGRTKTILNIKLFHWGLRNMIWPVLEARTAISTAGAEGSSPISATATPSTTTVTNVMSTAPDNLMERGSPE